MLQKIFLDHPQTMNENYLQHFMVAMSFSLRLAYASIVCLVHAILPCLFTTTGSQMIDTLHDEMVANRSRRRQQDPNNPGITVR